MDIRQLRHLIAIANTGTLTRAADELHVSRQAVAKTLRSVELQAGSRLFERRGGELSPTERGAALVQDARVIVDAFDNLCRLHLSRPSNARASGASRETLSVALVVGGNQGELAELINQFSRLNPRTMLEVEEMSTDAVLSAVTGGNADVGVVGSHPDLLDDVEACCVARVGAWLYVPAGSPLARRDVVGPLDLDGLPMVTMGRHNHLHRFVMARCALAGCLPDVRATTTDVGMIARLCHDDGLATFGFPPALVPVPDGIAAVRIDLPGADDFGTYVIRRRGAGDADGTPAVRSAQRFWNLARRLSSQVVA